MQRGNQKTEIIDRLKENKKYRLVLVGAVLLFLVLFTYRNSFDNDFVDWDDFTYVVNNNLVRNPGNSFLKDLFTTPVSSNYHPVTMLSLRLNNNVCNTCPNGISPAPFIRWNVILHILNTLLVLFLVFLLTRENLLAAFLAALLFGVHPMHVESVAWISERKDVLYTFFFLSGLIAYMFYKKGSKREYLWLVFSFILFVLSCLSKAVAVVFPVVLILINFWIYETNEDKPVIKAIKNSFSLKNLIPLIPFFIISVFLGLMAFRIQSGQNFLGFLDLTKSPPDVVNEIGPFTLFQRFQIASYGFIMYIVRFFVPVSLSALYQYPLLEEFNQGSFEIILIITMIATLATVVLVILSLKKTKLYAFSIGFYLFTIVFVLQFITVGMAIMAERYSYLPYAGLSLIPAILIANSSKAKRNTILVITGCFVIMLMVVTKRQIEVWNNTETLWSKVIEKRPQLELPRRSRGKYYSKKALQTKNSAEKKMYEDKALADFIVAIKAGTKSADVFEGTGVIYGSKGEPGKAVLFLDKAISTDPKKGSAYFNRALLYDQLNKKEEAIRDYNMALIFKPEMALQITNNRSNLLVETGRYQEAIFDYDYLISVDGNNFLYYFNRGYAKHHTNDIKGAIADYRKARQLNPNDQPTQMLLKKLSETYPGL